MKIIKKEGKSEFEVVTNFKKEFKLKENQFSYEIIQKGSNGFFSIFGMKPTIIEFKIEEKSSSKKNYSKKSTNTSTKSSAKSPASNPDVENLLKGILERVGSEYQKIETFESKDEISLNIIGAADAGFLIGKEGRFVNSLQHLLNRMKDRNVDKMIKLDVDGYNSRKENTIIRKAKGACKKAERTQKSVTLESMKPAERKIIHRFIEQDKNFRTITVGKGFMKRVVIIPNEEQN